MTDDVTLTLPKNGQTVLTDDYSVVTYATDFAAIYADNDAMLTLLCDMLDYGAAAQTYFGYKAEAPEQLANHHITEVVSTANANRETDFTWTAKTAPDKIELSGVDMSADLSAFGLKYAGASLMTTSKTAARLYFKTTDGFTTEGLTITCGNETLELVKKGSYYYVDIPLIAREIFTDKTVTFSKAGAESASLTYNAASYYNSIMSGSYSTELKNVLKTMHSYSIQAQAVLGQ